MKTIRFSALALFFVATATLADLPVEIKVDWAGRLPAVIKNPDKFGLITPHAADPAADGVWSESEGVATWRYAVRIPGAVNVSLHADPFNLPEGATFKLIGGGQSYLHTNQSDAPFGVLWSRVVSGDEARIEIAVPAGKKSELGFRLVEVVAGFKGLFGDPAMNETYRRLTMRPMAGGSDGANGCRVNFDCAKTAANAEQSRATVLFTTADSQCTGTLINNRRNDKKNYVVTAYHCQTSERGQVSQPNVRVYWVPLTPCGQALAVNNGLSPSTAGATSRAEFGVHSTISNQGTFVNGDSWLLELAAAPPAGVSVYYAGYDATDATPTNAFGIHHGAGTAQQHVDWGGSAQKDDGFALNTIRFWQMTSLMGVVEGGASGSALWDQNSRHIGVLSGSSPGNAGPSCTSAQSNGAAYNRFAQFWAGDGTASNSARFWLDPDSTGNKVLDGVGVSAPPPAPPPPPPPPPPTVQPAAGAASTGGGFGIEVLWVLALVTGCRRKVRR
ncbi:MAG: hypothetical protein AABY95_03930 [Pseudomonadota bacterium]